MAAALALFTLDLTSVDNSALNLALVRGLAIAYAILVGAAAFAAALLQDDAKGRWGRFTFTLAERLSSGSFLFGTAAFISIFGFYQNPTTILVLSVLWLFFALIRPVELIITLTNDWRLASQAEQWSEVGRVLRVDDPNILRASVTSDAAWRAGPQVACLADGSARLVIPLV